MAEPDFNFDNCGTNDPPQITQIIFEVDGVEGTPDFDGFDGNDVSNPPMVGKTIEVIPTYINDDTTEIITYRFFLSGSGTTIQSGPIYTIDDTVSAAGEQILCEVTIANSIGSVSGIIDMGIIYGLPPVLPDDITTVATFDPDLNSVLQPGQDITVTYTSALTESGSPDLVSINTVVNGQEFTGSSFTYTVNGNEESCQVTIQSVGISNIKDGIPNTGTDSRTYNKKIATVSDPVDGSPCGTPLGRCCWTGGFNEESGTTFGNCDILTAADCATRGSGGGIWTEGEFTCPDCDGSVGTPCCNDYGTGRCCCVQQDNSGLCVDGLTFGECNSSNPLFSQCGGSIEFPDIVWGHNLSCASSTEPPCVGPPTGRCCEVLLEGGTTCEIGLEELDCPRYIDSTGFAWSESGNCPDCTDPVQNLGYPCCEPLGRCCLRGDNDVDGFEERDVQYDVTEARCSELVFEGGWNSGVWTQYNAGKNAVESGLFVTCPDNTNSDCCVPVGRCCWKVGNVGDSQLNVTEEECAGLAGPNTREWIEGNNDVPDCNGNQLSTNLCCDTSIGRCCENNGVSNICTEDVIFDDCNDAEQDFARDQSCPPCDSGVGAPCCNGDASITNVRFDPDPVIAGNSTTLQATISGDDFSSRLFQYYVNDILRQTNTITSSDFNTNINDVGLELKGVVETTDLDGTTFSEEVTTTINGDPPVLPTTLNISSVSPGNNWPASLEPGDTITITGIQTTDGNPDSTIEWQFESLNGNLLSSGSELEPITIDYTVSASDVALEECGLKLRLTASNNLTEIPGTGSVSSVYPSPKGWTVSGDDGDPCGVDIGRCCVTGGFDSTTGITSASCTNGVSKADCDAINGAWGGENSVCPTCDGSVGTPCCPEIGTGRCCCTQTDNTGLCIDGVTFGGCTGSNPDFAGCGDSSPEGSITWFHNESCPNCAGSFDPPCCAPRTGRCCEILPEGNSEGLPPGVTCAVELEEFDCPRYFDSTDFAWSESGDCPNCTDPQDNLNNPVCCPEKLGRCCCTTDAAIFEGFCQANVTEAECDSLCGSASQTWTENTPADMPGGSQCPDCSDLDDPENELPCCNQRGRCCFKVEGDLDTPRLGRCFSGVTYGECQFLRNNSVPPAVTEIFFREDNPPCPNCGAGNDTNACCDDVDIPLGICCTNGVCEDNGGAGVLQTDCAGTFDDSTLVCPNCLDPDENEAGAGGCCPAGYPVLTIDQVLVGVPGSPGSVYDEITNPLVGGSEVTIQTTETNLDTVSYNFYIDGISLSTTKSYTIPEDLSESSSSIPILPGKTLSFEIIGTSPIPGIPSEELVVSIDIGTINGTPPTDIELGFVFSDVIGGFINNLPTTLEGGEGLTVFSQTVTGDIPSAVISYEWLDINGNFIDDGPSYTVSSDGVLENCGLKLKIIADNTILNPGGQNISIPGGAVYEETFDVGAIIAGGGDTPCSGVNLGTCCCGKSFDPVTGITGAECTPGITEADCDAQTCPGGRQWTDDDYSSGGDFCPTCDTTNQIGLPCCPEYPTGRCCKTGELCQDGIFESECDTANGFVWERDKICPITPCESDDSTEQRCGCNPSVTGACCCPFEGCIENVSESDCNGQYCTDNLKPSLYYAPGNPAFPNSDLKSPVWLGPNTTCPQDDTLDCNFMCCELGDKDLDINGNLADDGNDVLPQSCVGRRSDQTNAIVCQNPPDSPFFTNPCNGLTTNTSRKRCYAPVLPDGENLVLTTPCDYRYLTKFETTGQDYEFCALNGLCSCYKETPPNDSGVPREGCVPIDINSLLNYNNTTKSTLVGNPVYMCERVINNLDSFCAGSGGEWDATCVELSRQFCTFKKTSSGTLTSDNLLNQYCGVLKNSSLSYEQDWYSANCDTTNENHAAHQPLIDLNDEYVSVYKQEYYPCGQNTGSPTKDNSAEAINMNSPSEIYSEGRGLPCVDNSMLSGLSWQECRLLLSGCSIPGQGCATIQECIANCTVNIGDGPLQQGG